jgi:tripartite-type tricarboxylate transporter receptor subunit TctC
MTIASIIPAAIRMTCRPGHRTGRARSPVACLAHRDRVAVLARVVILALAIAAGGSALAADGWPVRPVRMVVAFPAGGGADVSARIVMPRLAEAIGQPVVIDNRPGANGGIGAETVVRSSADGYTLLYASSANITINPHVMRLSYDPMRDLVPVAMVAFNPLLLFVNPARVPVSSVRELVDFVRARPGQVDYASGGSGSQGHLAAELLNLLAGIQMVHVPYKGGPAAVNDVLAGQVGVSIAAAPPVLVQVRAGRLRGLATTGAVRSVFAPDLPTVAESGFPDFDVVIWGGVFAPAGSPRPVLDRLAAELGRIVREPEVRDALLRSGAEPMPLSGEALSRYLRTDFDRWAKVIRAARVTVE